MICIPIRYDTKTIMGNTRIRVCILNDVVFEAYIMYLRRIPCTRFNLVSYDTVTFALQVQKLIGLCDPTKIPNKKITFYGSVRELGQVLHDPPENHKFTRFSWFGLCNPSDIAGEPFCIQEFWFVTYQLIWSYCQKSLTFSSFTASNTYTCCFSQYKG